MGSVLFLLFADTDVGVEATAAADPEPPPTLPEYSWLVRGSVGLGAIPSSREGDVLDKEGYITVPRVWAFLDAAWLPTRHWGMGAWGAIAYRSEGSSSDSSTVFKERNTLLGPMIFYHHDWAFNRSWGLFSVFGGVRAGIGLGTPGVNGLGPVIDAPAVGIEAGVRFRLFGGSIGYLYAPTRASTELGQTYDLGGLYFLTSVYLGG
jgi:hypothetical protein